MTRDQYLNRQVPIPVNLFSHADQQNQMQTDMLSTQTFPTVGWGGLVADQIQAIYGSGTFPILVSLGRRQCLCPGPDCQAARDQR